MEALGVYGGGSSRSELSKACCDGGEDTVIGGAFVGAVAGLGAKGFDEGIGIWKLGDTGTPVTNYVLKYKISRRSFSTKTQPRDLYIPGHNY